MRSYALVPRCGLASWRIVRLHQGQALAEALVALVALLGLAWAVAWLGRLQDMGLQAQHAARHVAFLGAWHTESNLEPEVRGAFFDGQRHRWQDKQGLSWLPEGTQAVEARWWRLAPLGAQAQPAAGHQQGEALRHDWQLADGGVLRAMVRLQPNTALGPALTRQSYILQGAGHADSDAQVRQRVAQAVLPWAQAAQLSYALSERLTARMRPVDKAWGRADPEDEWLRRWQGFVPGWHVLTPNEAARAAQSIEAARSIVSQP